MTFQSQAWGRWLGWAGVLAGLLLSVQAQPPPVAPLQPVSVGPYRIGGSDTGAVMLVVGQAQALMERAGVLFPTVRAENFRSRLAVEAAPAADGGLVCLRWRGAPRIPAPEKNATCADRLALTRLLAQLWLAGALEGGTAADTARVPGWFVDGLVGETGRMFRQDSLRAAEVSWSMGQSPALQYILADQGTEPPDGEVGRLFRIWALEYCASRLSGRCPPWQMLRLAETNLAGLANMLAPTNRTTAPSQDWNVFIAQCMVRTHQNHPEWEDEVAQLKDTLAIHPELYGIAITGHFGSSLDLADLIEARDSEWMPHLARRVALRIRSLQGGLGPEWQAVLDEYAGVMEALAAPEKDDLMLEVRRSLLVRLQEHADETLASYEKLRAARRKFLDQVEQTYHS